MTRKIKTDPDRFDMKNVFEDDVLIASYWFCRNRVDRAGRVTVTCTGMLTYVDGREVNLKGYGYAADVARAIRNDCL